MSPDVSTTIKSTSNRNRRTNGLNNCRTPCISNTSAFKGMVTKMNGHVIQYYGEATEKTNSRAMEELDSYVGLHFKYHPAGIKKMIKLMEHTTIAMPEDHTEDATQMAICIWEKEVDMCVKQPQTTRNIQQQKMYVYCTPSSGASAQRPEGKQKENVKKSKREGRGARLIAKIDRVLPGARTPAAFGR
jgi:hypothetical protein